MLNMIEFYAELGTKAAERRNLRDESGYAALRDHFQRARDLERDEDRILASQVYDEAFREARNVPKPEYFR